MALLSSSPQPVVELCTKHDAALPLMPLGCGMTLAATWARRGAHEYVQPPSSVVAAATAFAATGSVQPTGA
jgi:hypothetical protein